MLSRHRAIPSITLERSRPVLITHLAPCRCRSPISVCKSCGTGGSSESACSVPSKSVEMSLTGNDILAQSVVGLSGAGVPPANSGFQPARHTQSQPKLLTCADQFSCHNVTCQNNMATLQEQYDQAMFDFS